MVLLHILKCICLYNDAFNMILQRFMIIVNQQVMPRIV